MNTYSVEDINYGKSELYIPPHLSPYVTDSMKEEYALKQREQKRTDVDIEGVASKKLQEFIAAIHNSKVHREVEDKKIIKPFSSIDCLALN